MQISVTPESKEKVPYKTLFSALFMLITDMVQIFLVEARIRVVNYNMDNVKEFREKIDNTKVTLILNLNTLIYTLANESPS